MGIDYHRPHGQRIRQDGWWFQPLGIIYSLAGIVLIAWLFWGTK